MNIIKITDNLTKADKYNLLTSPDCSKMSMLDGMTVEVKAIALVEDTDVKTGDVKRVVRLATTDGIYATNSASFIRSFGDILSVFELAEIHHLGIFSGKSNAGRTFLLCKYVD